MKKLLSPEEVEKKLHSLPLEWSVISGTQLQRNYTFDSYLEAAEYVRRIAGVADAANHHPEVILKYDSVDVLLTTHEVGGLTSADFALAKHIESVR